MARQQLFGVTSLTNYLDQRIADMKRKIAEIQDVEDLADPELLERYQVEPVRLLRDQAEFSTTTTDSGVYVEIKVPFVGPVRLLSCWVGDRADQTSLDADVLDVARRWGIGSDKEEHSSIRFTENFTDIDTDGVRAWAKELVDLTEQGLADQVDLINDHNARIRVEHPKLVDDRRRVLTMSTDLQGGLGKGI